MSRPLRIAINGYGRIGRCVLRAIHESGRTSQFDVIAINEPADLASMVYLTQFDSTHGVFPGTVADNGENMVVNGRPIRVLHAHTPEEVDWHDLELDMVFECSGRYAQRTELLRFIEAGCPRLMLSNPGSGAHEVDRTIVYGINHAELDGHETLVSAASCTTNAIVPLLHVLDDAFGVEHAFLTTLHSVMNDQPLIDGYHHNDLRRTRSAMQSIVPVETGLAQGVERLLPALAGKVQAKAIRVPILNVSAIDVMLGLRHELTATALNTFLEDMCSRFPGLLSYSHRPHASVDFNHNPHSAIIDASQTRTNGHGFANAFVWFDNEWGFANRMLDVASAWADRIIATRRDS